MPGIPHSKDRPHTVTSYDQQGVQSVSLSGQNTRNSLAPPEGYLTRCTGPTGETTRPLELYRTTGEITRPLGVYRATGEITRRLHLGVISRRRERVVLMHSMYVVPKRNSLILLMCKNNVFRKKYLYLFIYWSFVIKKRKKKKVREFFSLMECTFDYICKRTSVHYVCIHV